MRKLNPGDIIYDGTVRIRQYDGYYIMHDGRWQGDRYAVHEDLGRYDGVYEHEDDDATPPEPHGEIPPSQEHLKAAIKQRMRGYNYDGTTNHEPRWLT